MKRAQRWALIFVLGLVVTGNRPAVAQMDGLPDRSLTVTIHFQNCAGVDEKALAEAGKVVTEIFRKAGVESRWDDGTLISETRPESPIAKIAQGLSQLSNIWVNIYPRSMAEGFGLPSNVMGFAPGTERNRTVVDVFYNRVEAVYQKQTKARLRGVNATMTQILAHVIAHEIGHVLLNIPSHSATGIMRGDWDLKDLSDAAYGYLVFTPQQAEVIRSDVIRRVKQKQTAEVAGIESRTGDVGMLQEASIFGSR
jgi:hypothetical protein